MKDNRAIVHIADEAGREQRCINCRAVIHSRSWDGNPWPNLAVIVNHGNGGWSVLNRDIDATKERPCKGVYNDFERVITRLTAERHAE